MDSKKRLILIAVVVVVLVAGASVFFVFLARKNKAPSTFVTGTNLTETTTAPSTGMVPKTPSQTVPPAQTAPAPPQQTFTPPPPATPPADRTDRCQGGDPVALTIACSKKAFPKARSAQEMYISRADNSVDAFTATPLIAQTASAYLAVDSSGIGSASLAEINRVLVSQTSPVVILGGNAAVSPNVESQLRAAGFNNIKRLFGANRYQTASVIAEEVIKTKGGPILNAFLTEGSFLVDAYGIGPVVPVAKWPIRAPVLFS